MKSLLALAFAAVYGFILRYCWVFLNSFMEVISLSLLAVAPLFIGIVTVSLLGLGKVKNATRAFFFPWIVTMILLVLTIALSMEGAICWVIIYPFFSCIAGIGGVIGYRYALHLSRIRQANDNTDVIDDFQDHNSLKMSPLLLLPIVLGAIENDFFISTAQSQVAGEIIIAASPRNVWNALLVLNPDDERVTQSTFEAVLSLPKYQYSTLDTVAVGGRRIANYERGLYFEELITACEPDSLLRLRIKSEPGSIPPNVLDEHVVIGGKYFRALEDTYHITALPNGNCRLQLIGRVEFSTPFNWYTEWWAHWLMSSSFDQILENIAVRAQKAEAN